MTLTEKRTIKLPELDEYGTPKEKMPNCPRCEEDELGQITKQYAMCYNCSLELRRDSDSNLFVYEIKS